MARINAPSANLGRWHRLAGAGLCGPAIASCRWALHPQQLDGLLAAVAAARLRAERKHRLKMKNQVKDRPLFMGNLEKMPTSLLFNPKKA